MSALRAAALYALAIAWAKGLSLALLPLLTARLSPAEFGRLELLASAAEVAALVAGAGLVDALYRFAAPGGEAARRAAAAATGLALLLGGAMLGLVLAFAAPMAALLPGGAAPEEPLLLGIAVAMGPVIGVGLAWLRVQGEAARYAGFEALRASAQAALVAALLLAGAGVAGVLGAGAVVATGAALALVWRQARQVGIALAPRDWGRHLAYGGPLIGSGLAGFALGTADRWVLAGAVPAEVLGQYGLAAKLALVAAVLTQPFELWWYPRRLAVLGGPDGLARSATVVGTGAALALLAAAAAALAGPVAIMLATPAAYHPAAALVPWLAAIVALQALGSLINVGCYAGRTGARPLLANGAAGALAVLLYLALIPPFGVAGTIAATLAAQALRFALFLRLSRRAAPVAYPLARIAVLAALAAGVAALPQALGIGAAGILAGAAGFVALGAAALALGLLRLPAARGGWRHA